MASVLGFVSRNYTSFFPPSPPKDAKALRFGILGAANIAPIALINPALSHPGVIIEGIAARDVKRAEAFAKRHSIKRVFPTYQALLDDPNIDAVYNPLPNSHHYEWTIKALKAGKHVLLEKPSGNTADETIAMFKLAKEKNLVLLEAFHYRFHPAVQTVQKLVDSGVIGKITGADSTMALPGVFSKDDIRFKYELGGGATMDLGCYAISILRYILHQDPTDITKIAVNKVAGAPKIDRSLRAIFEMEDSDVTASIYVDFDQPKLSLLGPTPFLRVIPRIPEASIKIWGSEGTIYFNPFAFPSLWHSITIEKGQGPHVAKVIETKKAYTFEELDPKRSGEAWWTTYRYQLEAFVDKVQGREPQTWVTAEDSIENMRVIDALYNESGLGVRPTSAYLGNEN